MLPSLEPRSPPPSPPQKGIPLRRETTPNTHAESEPTMYPISRSGLYHDGYYHPKPAALNQSTLSLILTDLDVRAQRLQAHENSEPKIQSSHHDLRAQEKYFQERQKQARMHAEAKHRYEEQAYWQQLQKRQALEKRRNELRDDPSALFRHYNEYMMHFPMRRGERPNRYHMGLLANQEMPENRESERAVAIAYAKAHWENAWEDKKDYKFVVDLIRNEKKKNKASMEAKSRANI